MKLIYSNRLRCGLACFLISLLSLYAGLLSFLLGFQSLLLFLVSLLGCGRFFLGLLGGFLHLLDLSLDVLHLLLGGLRVLLGRFHTLLGVLDSLLGVFSILLGGLQVALQVLDVCLRILMSLSGSLAASTLALISAVRCCAASTVELPNTPAFTSCAFIAIGRATAKAAIIQILFIVVAFLGYCYVNYIFCGKDRPFSLDGKEKTDFLYYIFKKVCTRAIFLIKFGSVREKA